jgi:hypothetical protein
MHGHLGKQHSSVTLELRCRSALRVHVRIVGAGFKPAPTAQGNADGDFPTGAPCIWPCLNGLTP